MKRILLTFFCCYTCILALAQSTSQNITVKGLVIDSTLNKPLGYVTIAIVDVKTHQSVKGSLTKDDGSFELSAKPGKTYQLELAFIGYKNKTIALDSSKTSTDVGKVVLSAATNQLKEVSITAVRPLMKQEVDRISYDVQADPESKALTALDMMRKVPLLSVDAGDNIKLKGSGNYKILINGRESALMAKNPSDVLKAMPATNIEKIEVITTPPAKYDAEGLAGIINIITKKNMDQGYNIGVNTRYNTLWGTGLNLNATVKQGKFGFSGYAGFGKQNSNTTAFGNNQTFFNDKSILSQTGTNTFFGNYKYANGELSYEIDSLNLLTGSVELYREAHPTNIDGISQTDSSGIITQQYRQKSNNINDFTGVDLGINYQLGFKRNKEQLLTLSYKYSYSPNKQSANTMFTDRVNYSQPDFQQYNNAGNREHTIQLDYVHPLKKLNIEAGGKVILRNNFSDFKTDSLDVSTGDYILNQGQSNNFDYHQNVYGFYNSYQLKLNKWIAKGGLRLEHTTVDANFTSVGSTLSTNYNNLIPSVSIQRTLKSSSINFGFTERIQRPGIYQLNPFVDRSNPKFVNTGNPNLQPELNHVFELTYSNFSKGSINAGLSYSFSNNSIQNVTSRKVDIESNQPDTVTFSTYQNLGSNQSFNLNLNANYSLSKKLSVNINAQLSHVWLKGTYNGNLYKNDGYTGNAFTSVSYNFAKNYRFGFNLGYYSGDVNLQGKSKYFIFSNYVVSRDFFDKKASISLVANNPYSKYWNGNSYTRTSDFYQQTTWQQPYRSFVVRLNYKFGKLNSDIKKNKRGINNDDTKGGTKSSGNQ